MKARERAFPGRVASRSRGPPSVITSPQPSQMSIYPAAAAATALDDLPDVILSNTFALVSDTRARNSLSIVCRKYCAQERATRTFLTIRCNVKDLYRIPTCFRRVTALDLSFLSPWGHDLLSAVSHPFLLADAFPLVKYLTVYARSPSTLHVLLPRWPRLHQVKLVRLHPRPQAPIRADFAAILAHCRTLLTLDVSSFYHYTENLHPVLVSTIPNKIRTIHGSIKKRWRTVTPAYMEVRLDMNGRRSGLNLNRRRKTRDSILG